MSKEFGRHAFRWCSIFLGLFANSQSFAQNPDIADCRSEFENVDRKDKSGPLPIYQLPDKQFLIEIGVEEFESEFIYSNYIERGIAPYVGQYAEPKLISFRLNGEKIDVVENDSFGFFADDGPLSKTRALTMSDSVITSLKMHSCQPGDSYFAYIDQDVLTSMSSEFLDEFYDAFETEAEIKDWKSFSDNINFVSEHLMSTSRRSSYRSAGSTFSIQVRHLFIERRQEAFRSRRQDSRVGYFSVYRKNLAEIDQSITDIYINKWRLEKKNPDKAISKPVQPIVFWIENTTPEKFRPYIREGVLAWNEAFLAAGFSDAIEVYQQPAEADWEAGDISKNVIRWQVAYEDRDNFGFAPSVHDPVTGEILGADILLNYAGIGDYLDDWARLSGTDSFSPTPPLARSARIRSTQGEQSRQDKVSNVSLAKPNSPFLHIEGSYILASLIDDYQKFAPGQKSLQDFNKITSPTSTEANTPHIQKTNVNETLGAPTVSPAIALGLAERLVKEVITELTMHEVGHALGLTHNFSGSHWRSMDEIFDKEKTNGTISASVMDYLPINFSPIGMEQGDFANTRLGPYDIWAIEFGYSPELNEAKRESLLEKAASPGYAFSAFPYGSHPNSLLYDLTNAPVEFAASRIKFAAEVSKLAAENDIFDDQRQYSSLYRELRHQISQGVDTITAQVGASVSPNSAKEQKKAIKTLEQLIFSKDKSAIADGFFEQFEDGQYYAFADQLGIKRSVLSSLMFNQALLFRHHSGNQLSTTDLLFEIKNAVFGADLYPLGLPDKDRRDQQIIYAHYLAALIYGPTGDEGGRHQAYFFESSITSAAARPVRNALMRELWLPTPWAPLEVRAHRQQLRAILR